MATNSKHRPRAASQGPVFSRLQNLFPPNTSQPPPSHALRARPVPEKTTAPPQKPVQAMRKAFKVRILTWNMHDSVPKGDLEELFGKVPLWSSNSTSPDVGSTIPVFPLEADHPYHLVVVAGQECPSLSGIPMGLGAGFKLIDKDRDRDKDSNHRDKEYDKPRHKHMSLSLSREGREKDKDKEEEPPEPPSGWTSMIEDWLCQGSGSGVRSATGSPTVADVGSPKQLTPRPSVREKEAKKGPYQLLIKERMMGIYLAVYVHREVRGLVRGTSRSAVTAGLIGGRVGNKGGVGITMNLDGTTFLFLNAHLAAHEGRVNHRLSNLAKIKAELSVDDWLAHDDPRVMAEDLTDKFDYSFLCGDLNFRLDISRLHADWLMSRKEYAQALAFDQLTNLMARGEAFYGFREAPINFPPTFKYDVLRTLKRAKRRGSKMDRWRRPGERSHRLTEVEEKELEKLEKEEAAKIEDEEGEEAEGGEGASMASSNWTSAHSRMTERDKDRDRDLEDEEFYTATGPSQTNISASTSKVSLAMHAAKTKWRSLLPSSNHKAKVNPHATRSSVEVSNGLLTPVLTSEGAQSQFLDRLRQPPMIFVNDKSKSSLPTNDDDHDSQLSEEEEEIGVYDSSHKKRVPSWCDRILWKTTVEPEPEPESEDEEEREVMVRPRTARINQFFANAFRPLSTRVRKDSWASMTTSTPRTSGELEDRDNYGQAHEPSPSSSPEERNVLEAARPFSRFVQVPGTAVPKSPLAQVKSHENPLPGRSPVRGHTHPELGLRRTSSTNFSTPASGEQPRHTMRRATASSAIDAHAPPSRSVVPQLPPLPYTVAQAPISRWRFFPSFFSHASTQSSTSLEPPASAEPAPPPPPRKGDVLCLRYDTLDDRGMRRLEGRSDHRPVIGSYAIYL